MSSRIVIPPRRGEIWMVDLEPVRGSELQKIRPCVVVSSDGLGKLPVKLVAPITEWKQHHPLDVGQLSFADSVSQVIDVSFYHGGEELYTLRDIPGVWHEACLHAVFLA